ncbi:hypothetical protein [Streptomyces corynorhini]|uniref:Uncharacterized protein n=1 Tax=Streptomyces corynorhini TaxID=2282652 RepID=A0A370B839_9ACTN|nr:hypothetical protein [Streptomyces corynorhini]RDG37978.1 hypothetical protein DVH02_11685 [Streptomyces corynorhini]
MDSEGTVLGVIIAVVGVIGAVLVARVSTPRPAAGAPEDDADADELRVSPEIWRRFEVLEQKVDHLTSIVEHQKEKVTALERLLRMAMRIVRRANVRLVARQEPPEEIPTELIPYSLD